MPGAGLPSRVMRRILPPSEPRSCGWAVAGVTGGDVEVAVGAERDAPAVVVARLGYAGEDRRRVLGLPALERQAHDAVVVAGGEVEVDRVVAGEVGETATPSRPPSPPGSTPASCRASPARHLRGPGTAGPRRAWSSGPSRRGGRRAPTGRRAGGHGDPLGGTWQWQWQWSGSGGGGRLGRTARVGRRAGRPVLGGLGEDVVGVTRDGADTPSSSPDAPEHDAASSPAARTAIGAVRMPHCALWSGARPGGRSRTDNVRP